MINADAIFLVGPSAFDAERTSPATEPRHLYTCIVAAPIRSFDVHLERPDVRWWLCDERNSPVRLRAAPGEPIVPSTALRPVVSRSDHPSLAKGTAVNATQLLVCEVEGSIKETFVSAQRGAHVAAVEAKVQLAVRSYGELADWQAFLDNTEPSTSVKASDDRDSSDEGIEVLLNAFGNSPPGPARDEALRKYANAIQHAAARDVRKEYESIAAEQLLQCGDYLPIEISSARGGGAHIAVMRIDTFNASGDGRSEARLFIMGGEGVEKGDKIQRRVIWDVAGHKRERVGFVGTVL